MTCDSGTFDTISRHRWSYNQFRVAEFSYGPMNQIARALGSFPCVHFSYQDSCGIGVTPLTGFLSFAAIPVHSTFD